MFAKICSARERLNAIPRRASLGEASDQTVAKVDHLVLVSASMTLARVSDVTGDTVDLLNRRSTRRSCLVRVVAALLDHKKDPKNAPPIPASTAAATAPAGPNSEPPIPAPRAAPIMPPTVAIVTCSLADIIISSTCLHYFASRRIEAYFGPRADFAEGKRLIRSRDNALSVTTIDPLRELVESVAARITAKKSRR